MATSGQFLTVPPSHYRSSQHHRRERVRAAESPRTQHPASTSVASSSKLKLEDTPLGSPLSAPSSSLPPLPPPTTTTTTTTRADSDTTTTASTSSSSSPQASLTTSQAGRQKTRPALPAIAPTASPTSTNLIIPPPCNPPGARPQPSPQLSPRSIFRAMSFLLPLRSRQSDLLSLTCTSGGPRTHAVLSKCQIDKASQALTYNKALVCADAVNAEILLRLARNELLERAQQVNRLVVALVDEEWRYTIRQTKSSVYNVQVFYSACPAYCESENSNVAVDPRRPVALSHVTNIPGLMRVVDTE